MSKLELSPEDLYIIKELNARLLVAVKKLPRRLCEFIYLYYFLEYNYKQIGEIMHVSESRSCQMHKKALEKLKRLF